jgi:hypothetical protein
MSLRIACWRRCAGKPVTCLCETNEVHSARASNFRIRHAAYSMHLSSVDDRMRCRDARSRTDCDCPLSCQLRARRIQHRSAFATSTIAQRIESEHSIRRLCSGCYSDDASSNHIGVRPPAHGQSVADVMFWTASRTGFQALLRQRKA